jgi:hypothetical protein
MKATISFEFDDKGKRSDGCPTPDGLLLEAENLTMLGYIRASAMTARTALHLALEAQCRKTDCWPVTAEGHTVKQPAMEQLVNTLKRADQFSQYLFLRLQHATAIGNRAAHGRPITPRGVFVLLSIVGEIIEQTARKPKLPAVNGTT